MAAILHAKFFKSIFPNENVWILIKISLKFVPKGPLNNILALVQIMAWRQAIIWTNDAQVYWCIYASLDLDMLKNQGWDKLTMFCKQHLQMLFLGWKYCILILISQKFGPKDLIDYVNWIE